MMRKKLWAAGLAAALAWTANSRTEHPAAPEPPGPGVIFHAVRSFVGALDQGEPAAIGQMMTAVPGAWLANEEGSDDLQVKNVEVGSFFDVDAQGKALVLKDRDAIAGAVKGAKTKVLSMVAECPSSRIAFAVLHLERTTGEGEAAKSVRMRATALLTEEDGKWKVFHWHASRA